MSHALTPERSRLVEKRRAPSDYRYAWQPFEAGDEFTPDWWDRTPHDDDPLDVEHWDEPLLLLLTLTGRPA